jgi:asparagine synthase (glutamine-hydrolysing)
MCGIAGFCNYNEDFSEEAPFLGQLARRMGNTLRHRGPNEKGSSFPIMRHLPINGLRS